MRGLVVGGTHSGVGKTVETRFATEKWVRQVTLGVEGCGPVDGAAGVASGYEIRMGRTTHQVPLPEPLEAGSAATGFVLERSSTGCSPTRGSGRRFSTRCSRLRASNGPAPDESLSPYVQAAELVEEIDLSDVW